MMSKFEKAGGRGVSFFGVCAGVVLSVGVGVGEGRAATFTWDGGGMSSGPDHWDNQGGTGTFLNWVGNPTKLPTRDDSVVFASGLRNVGGLLAGPDLHGRGWSVNSATFKTLEVDIRGGATSGGATDGGLYIHSGDVTVEGTASFSEFRGDVTIVLGSDSGTNPSPVGSIAEWDIQGAGTKFSMQGVLEGPLPFEKQGAGVLRLGVTGTAIHNTNSGLTTVVDGTLEFFKPDGFNAVGGDIQVGDGAGSAGSAILDQDSRSNQIPNGSDVMVESDGLWDMGVRAETIGALTGSGLVDVGHLTVGSGGATGTFSGVLQSAGGTLTKIGGGTQTLSGSVANTHTGLTTVADGVLVLNKSGGANAVGGGVVVGNDIDAGGTAVLRQKADGSLGAGAGVTVKSDGRWDLLDGATHRSQTINAFGGTGLVDLGHLTVGNGGGSGTFSGVLQGASGTLTKVGGGTLTLSGSAANTHTGLTTVNNGTLQLAKVSGVATMGGDVKVGDGVGAAQSAVLNQVSSNTIPDGSNVVVKSDGRWNVLAETVGEVDGSGRIDVTVDLGLGGGSGVTSNFSGVISGPGILTKKEAGTHVLEGSAANTHTGLTRVNHGTLTLRKDAGVDAVGGDLRVGNNAGGANTAKLRTPNDDNIPNGSDVEILSDGSWIMGAGTSEMISRLLGTGRLTVEGLSVGSDGSDGDYGGVLEGTGTFRKVNGGRQTLSGGSPNTFTGLMWVAAGTVRLDKNDGVDALAGGLQIGNGGVLVGKLEQFGNDNLPDTTNVQVESDGWWELKAGALDTSETINEFNGVAGAVVTLGDLTVSSGDYAGVLDGTGTLTKAGGGMLTLSGPSANTHTGLTKVQDGELRLIKIDGGVSVHAVGGDVRVGDGIGAAQSAVLSHGKGGQVPDTSDVQVMSDGFWDLRDGTANRAETINALDGDGVVELGFLTVGADGGSGLFSGLLKGIRLNKDGAGTQTVTGANTYTGQTAVMGGTLVVANTSGSGTGSSAVTVQSGGRLAGDGSVDGAVTVQGGGVFGPGTSAGVFTVNNDLTLEAGATLEVEVEGAAVPVAGVDFDQVAVTGSVSLAGTLEIVPLPDAETFSAALGTTYPVMTFSDRGGTVFDLVTGSLLTTGLALAPQINPMDVTLRVSMPGDVNFDNKVSVADLSEFALNFGTTPGIGNWGLGDFNGDGGVTVSDLSLLALNFGFGVPDAAGAVGLSLEAVAEMGGIDLTNVPEPGVGVLVLGGLLGVVVGRGRRR